MSPDAECDFHTYYVRDNGLGIPEAHRGKLFQPFQRLHPNVATGEGIGLTLIRRMVERHGGEIWVESIEGEGSTFFVKLPARTTRSRDLASIENPQRQLSRLSNHATDAPALAEIGE